MKEDKPNNKEENGVQDEIAASFNAVTLQGEAAALSIAAAVMAIEEKEAANINEPQVTIEGTQEDKEEIKEASPCTAQEEQPVKTKREKLKEFFTVKRIAYLSIFSALSIVFYLFVVFPIPVIFPAFLEFNFSDVPALIGGYMLGPLSGGIIIVFRFVAKMLSGTSITYGIGEIADLLLGLAFVIPAALVYKKFKSTKGAIVGLAVGSGTAVAAAVFLNRFLIVPVFALVIPGGMQTIVATARPLFPNITEANFFAYYLPASVIPFNIIRTTVASFLAFGLYQGLKRADKKMFPERKKQKKDKKKQKTPNA